MTTIKELPCTLGPSDLRRLASSPLVVLEFLGFAAAIILSCWREQRYSSILE
jgi:hypothetical protein